MKISQTPFWNNFGTVALKTEILEHRPGSPGVFLCLLSEQHIRNTLRCPGFIFFDDMAVEIFRCVHAGMTQLFRYRDNIRTVCQKDGGHSMPEGMRIDVGQIVTAGKVVEPAGDAVRIHVAAIVCGEHKAGMLPAVTIGKL